MKILHIEDKTTHTRYVIHGWINPYAIYYIKYTTESEVSGYYYENGKALDSNSIVKLLDAIAEAKARKFLEQYA